MYLKINLIFLNTAVVPDPEAASSDGLSSWGSSLSVFSRLSFSVKSDQSEVEGCLSSDDDLESESGKSEATSAHADPEESAYAVHDDACPAAVPASADADVRDDACSEAGSESADGASAVSADGASAASADVPVRGVKRKFEEMDYVSCSKRHRLTEDSWIALTDPLEEVRVRFSRMSLC